MEKAGNAYADLRAALQAHQPADAQESADVQAILAFCQRHQDPFDRRIAEGHLTASAVIVSAASDALLLVHHRKLQRWLQPGGHAEAGEQIAEQVAAREAREETGIPDLVLHPRAPRPLDVDVHRIPARGDEPAHLHLDLRYLFLAPASVHLVRQEEESSDLRWFGWDSLDGLDLDAGLRRAVNKVRLVLGLAGPAGR